MRGNSSGDSPRVLVVLLLLLDLVSIVCPVAALRVPEHALWISNALAIAPFPAQTIAALSLIISRRRAPPNTLRHHLHTIHLAVSILVAAFFSYGVLIILFPRT